MKKLLIVIAFLSVSIGHAQEEKNIFIAEGRWSVGGAFALSNNSNTSEYDNDNYQTESFWFVAMPKVGYTIADNLLLGMRLRYDYSRQETSNNENTSNTFGFAPTIQKFFPVSDNLAFSLQGSLEYSRRLSRNPSSTTDSSVEESYSAAIRPGISYFLGQHFALEAEVGNLSYSILQHDRNDVRMSEGQSLRLDFGLSNINFGATYYF